jgi:hypothetical protein
LATFTDARKYADYQRKRAQSVQDAMNAMQKEGVARLVEDLEVVAFQLTSGTFDTKELAELGHPYSRRPFAKLTGKQQTLRQFIGSINLLPINYQTGLLQSQNKLYTKRIGNGTQIWYKNDAPYAGYILSEMGTRTMQPRGFLKEMRKIAGQLLEGIQEAAVAAKRAAEKDT